MNRCDNCAHYTYCSGCPPYSCVGLGGWKHDEERYPKHGRSSDYLYSNSFYIEDFFPPPWCK